MKISIADIRNEYSKQSLNTAEVSKDPIKQFEQWFEEAVKAEVMEVNAMNLSTVTKNGFPASRIVLLKGITAQGFTFYTNYQSNKGRDLEENPVAALTFFWPELERQVRIQGVVEKLSKTSSEKYFQSRPKSSQIGAWASPQSAVIKSRELLEERQEMLSAKYKDNKVLPKPEQWGGYIVSPFMVEFWQGRQSRLHDRVMYMLAEDKKTWKTSILAP